MSRSSGQSVGARMEMFSREMVVALIEISGVFAAWAPATKKSVTNTISALGQEAKQDEIQPNAPQK